MFQRIQTIYLIAVVATGIAMLCLPLVDLSGNGSAYSFKATGITQVSGETNPLLVPVVYIVIPMFGVILTAIISLVTIFSYKNRMKQIKLGNLNLLLLTGLLAAIFLVPEQIKNLMENPNEVIVNYGISSILPIISIILTWLANNAIKKDEKLVKSADRIR